MICFSSILISFLFVLFDIDTWRLLQIGRLGNQPNINSRSLYLADKTKPISPNLQRIELLLFWDLYSKRFYVKLLLINLQSKIYILYLYIIRVQYNDAFHILSTWRTQYIAARRAYSPMHGFRTSSLSSDSEWLPSGQGCDILVMAYCNVFGLLQ